MRYLINGTTVRQTPVDEVSYHHVELPRHAVLLAEGMFAESYLDTGGRGNFANGGEPVALHPDFTFRTWDAEGCAPLVVTGPLLQSARERLNAFATALGRGFTRTADRTSSSALPPAAFRVRNETPVRVMRIFTRLPLHDWRAAAQAARDAEAAGRCADAW